MCVVNGIKWQRARRHVCGGGKCVCVWWGKKGKIKERCKNAVRGPV